MRRKGEIGLIRFFKFKKLSAVILSLFTFTLILFSQSIVIAEETPPKNYTALGDSIAFGMSVEHGKGYVDLFYSSLKAKDSGITLNNFGKPGDKSSDLLLKLQGDATIKASLAKSSTVTISIGGNNLLQPVFASLAQAFNVNTVNNPNMLNDLTASVTSNAQKDAILFEVMSSPELKNALNAGVDQFTKDFPKIIQSVKAAAPNAKIYIMNIYNPFSKTDAFYNEFDGYIKAINDSINTANSSYKVVDAYTLFKYNSVGTLTSFNISKSNFDPHPSTEGHRLLFLGHITLSEDAVKNGDTTSTYTQTSQVSNSASTNTTTPTRSTENKNTLSSTCSVIDIKVLAIGALLLIIAGAAVIFKTKSKFSEDNKEE